MVEILNEISYTYLLDAEGLLCPEPLMMLHRAIRKANSAEVVYMRATDPSTVRDVVKFCAHLGHTLLSQQECDGVFAFWIAKK